MNTKLCPTCKTPIPAHAPGGFCPACILRDADELPPIGRAAPSLAEVSAAFPQLEVLALIGQGGMGFVYKVRQPSLDRTVALKILSPELGRDPAFAERFAREARVLGKLNHPNIVTVFESGVVAATPSSQTEQNAAPGIQYYYLTMEFVDGVNLRQAMRAGRFTPQQALAVVPGICDALQAAHAQGVWHRDIKPENILLDAQGGVKIVDFGIARLVGDPRRDFTLTVTGAALGSAAYMAPEQHEKPHDVDHRADIYSLGVVIYEMLTGELPLGRFPAPSARAAVDARIDEIVFQTLEKERNLRQQSAEEVKTDVHRAASTSGKPHTRYDSPIGRLPKYVVWAVCLLLGGISLGGVGWFTMVNFQNAASGAAVLAGLGGVAFVLGLLGTLRALYEIKCGRLVQAGRWLLIGVSIVPLAASAITSAGALFLWAATHRSHGGVLSACALTIIGLATILWLLLSLARPLSEATPLRKWCARTGTVLGALCLLGAVFFAKKNDGVWPNAYFREKSRLLMQSYDTGRVSDLQALLRKAAGHHADDYLLRIEKEGRNVVVESLSPVRSVNSQWNNTSNFRDTHSRAVLTRLRDLLPPDVIKDSQIWSTYPPYTIGLKRLPIAVLGCLGVLLVSLARTPRSVWIILGAVAFSLAGILAPSIAGNTKAPRPVFDEPLPMWTAADITQHPNFSTPENAVMSVFDAACWGDIETVKLGVSKALTAKLDEQDGWREFIDHHQNMRAVAINRQVDRRYGQEKVGVFKIYRYGKWQTFSDSIYVVKEDGEWRLDQLTYIGKKGEIAAPATWFANKKSADAAKVTAQPEASVAVAPSQIPPKVTHKVGIFPDNRLVLDGKAVDIDELGAFLKQWVAKDELEGVGVHIEKGSDAAFARKVHKLLMDGGVHFDAEAMRAFNETPVVGAQSIPGPIAAVVPAPPAESIFRKMNSLANESNGDEFKKHLAVSTYGKEPSGNMADRMEPFLGKLSLVKTVAHEPGTKGVFSIRETTTVFGAFERADGKMSYREFRFTPESGEWRYQGSDYPKYRAVVRVEFRPESGNATAILRTHLDSKVVSKPVAGADGQFDIESQSSDAVWSANDANAIADRLTDSLKKVGLDAALKVIKKAGVPTKPIHAEEELESVTP